MGEGEGEGEGEGVIILSKHPIQPSPRANQGGGGGAKSGRTIHLTAWDLRMIPMNYIQKGILFQNPNTTTTTIDMQVIVSSLLSSFSAAIDQFFPLAGRLRATAHNDSSSSSSSSSFLSVSLECNDQGAEFVRASALSVTVSDLLTPYLIPTIVNSFFPLNGLLNHDGLDKPLLAAQVTELADGFFVAISLNHVVADGTNFWHFFNTWSEICRSGTNCNVNPQLVFDRWFPDSCPPPHRLPFRQLQDLAKTTVQLPSSVQECFLHFSAESIARLKSRANAEMGTDKISSLQSLLAHVWRSVTRARGLKPEQETTYVVVVGHRSRLGLPQSYVGNSVLGDCVKSSAGEVVGEGLGRAAWRLNQAIALHTQVSVREWYESWTRNPGIQYLDQFRPTDLMTGSSPRFDVYGNDFGWGKPVAVRSGLGAKVDGKVTVYPGPESGSMALELCLSPKALTSLLEDEEFMELAAALN